MLRRIIKVDEDGNEMVDEDGQFIFEEVEIPSAKSSEQNSTNSTESNQISDTSSNSVSENDSLTEETANNNSESVEQNSWKEKINNYGLTEEEVWNLVDRFRTQLNSEEALEKVAKLPEEKKQKIIMSLGINLKDKKIN